MSRRLVKEASAQALVALSLRGYRPTIISWECYGLAMMDCVRLKEDRVLKFCIAHAVSKATGIGGASVREQIRVLSVLVSDVLVS